MDFRLTPEQEAFRAEVRDWLSQNLPPDWGGRPVSDLPRAGIAEASAADRHAAVQVLLAGS